MNKQLVLSLFILIFLGGLIYAGGELTEDLTINNFVVGETFTIGDSLMEVGDLIGPNLDDSYVSITKVELIKKQNENTLISFLNGGEAKIGEAVFEDVKEGSKIELNSLGEITFADLTAIEDTTFTIDGQNYGLLAGMKLEYKDGKSVIYGKEKDFILVKGESDEGFTQLNLLGDELSFEYDEFGNSIIEGNFKIGNNEFKGLSEGKKGKITYSKSTGRTSTIWSGTSATIDGIENKVSGDYLNVYYDNGFNTANHLNENYINIDSNSVSLGGKGFTTDLTKSKILSNIPSSKEVKGIGTKTRELEFKLYEGNLEISKGEGTSFNINGNGNYEINNGRAIIRAQELSNGYNLLEVKAAEDKDGLLYSYDLNFNEGKYRLENNVFTNEKGYVRFNVNKEWEDVVYSARKISSDEANSLKYEMLKENKLIYTDSKPKDFLAWIQGEDGEAIMKGIYDSTYLANQNKYDVKVSFLDVYNGLKSEGAGNMQGPLPLFIKFVQDPNENIFPVDFGLTSPGDLKTLIKGGFLPQNFKTIASDYGGDNMIQTKDAFTYFSGVLAYKKYLFLSDFEELYGNEKLTRDEENYWTTYYFNAGEGNGKKALKDRKKNYVLVWDGGKPEVVPFGNPKFNARLRNDFEYYLKKLGLFNYPA